MENLQELISKTAVEISPWVRRTPILNVSLPELQHPLTLKLELLQHSGSFKVRGAFANLLRKPIPEVGVAAASGGNHGAAVAYAAHKLTIPAHIFVPTQAPPAKIGRIESYGAQIILAGDNYGEAVLRCEAFVAQTGAMNVHAYNSLLTIAGQGSLGVELEEQAPELDTILVAVGGGGLIAGVASHYHGRCKIIGVESERCNSLYAALQAGNPVKISPSGVAADSLGAGIVGSETFPLAQAFVDHVELVSDEEIRAAQRYLWSHCQLVTEAGGAAAFAALASGRYRPEKTERVGVILCGANTGLGAFTEVIEI